MRKLILSARKGASPIRCEQKYVFNTSVRKSLVLSHWAALQAEHVCVYVSVCHVVTTARENHTVTHACIQLGAIVYLKMGIYHNIGAGGIYVEENKNPWSFPG